MYMCVLGGPLPLTTLLTGQFPGEPLGKVPGKNGNQLPALATKPNSHRPTPPWGTSKAGQCLDNLLALSGLCLPWASCQ